MNLRQWTSNSNILNDQARSDGVNAALTIKVLGLVWNAETDTLSLSLAKLCEEISNTERFTKRSVLSLSSKLFDPLGFVEPVTAKAKIMMQKLWKTNTAWDNDIPENHKENWTKWLHELKNLTSLVIPRHYFKSVINDVQLHVFCDSSMLAYGAVAYLRYGTPEGTKCTFLMSKSKVAPVKQQTMPRLELLAALLGAQLSKYLSKAVLQNFQPFQTVLWSDSQITLSWISSTKPLRQQFIRHRVQLIIDITSPSTWRFCPTTSNPADIITRGLDPKAFISKQEYWNQGPSWLLRPPQEWPSNTIGEIQDTESTVDTTSITTNVANTQENTNLLNVIDITRYSTLNKTLRITALVIRFTRKLRGKTNSQNTITAIDMKYACVTLVKSVQQIHYGEIISKLKHKDKP